jgi:AAA domain
VADPQPQPIKATAFKWRDPSTIPTRKFLYGRHTARGFVSVTAAMSGVGKTTLLLAESLALGLGRDLLGVVPRECAPVWYLGLEDPLEEYERRIAAIGLRYGITGPEMEQALFLDSGRDQNFVIATEEKNGVKIIQPVVDAIIDNVRKHRICQLVIDPFVGSHSVSENDNVRLEKVTKEWAHIAHIADCAIDLVHHFRKSGSVDPTAEDVRGAGSIVGSSRSVRLLAGMTKEEAEAAGVEERRRYFRVLSGKASMFLASDDSDWFKMESISLGNGAGGPSDEVGVATVWTWPDPLASLSVADLRTAQTAVSHGRWRESSQAKDWVGKPIAEALKLDIESKAAKAKIKGLLKIWMANGMFVVVEGKDDKRETRSFVEVGTWADD